MKIYPQYVNRHVTESDSDTLDRKLKAAAKGFLSSMRAMREATTKEEQYKWRNQAKRFKAYLERIGKNK